MLCDCARAYKDKFGRDKTLLSVHGFSYLSRVLFRHHDRGGGALENPVTMFGGSKSVELLGDGTEGCPSVAAPVLVAASEAQQPPPSPSAKKAAAAHESSA